MLISDVFMPEMLETDLAMRVKERNADCRILLFSGDAAQDRSKTGSDDLFVVHYNNCRLERLIC